MKNINPPEAILKALQRGIRVAVLEVTDCLGGKCGHTTGALHVRFSATER